MVRVKLKNIKKAKIRQQWSVGKLTDSIVSTEYIYGLKIYGIGKM